MKAAETPSIKLKNFFTKISKKSHVSNKQLSRLISTLNKTLLSSMDAIIDIVPMLQQDKLSPEKRKEYANSIHQAALQAIEIVKETTELTEARLATHVVRKPPMAKLEVNEMLKPLIGLNVIVINEDPTQKNKLNLLLEELGIKCTIAAVETALQVLYTAQQGSNPFQMAIINVTHYNHHVAYLGRTIKANIHLGHVMTCLVLSTELLTFEKEQAYFDGFACILNLQHIEDLPEKLAASWRGWMAKLSFVYGESLVNKNRILLVEDDPIQQKVTHSQLSELGYSVDTASDGHTALKLLSQNMYDLVFMDIGLPDISGLEVTAEIRKRETGLRHTPIIGLTIYALKSDEKTGLQAGMDDYLIKPATIEHLTNILKHWLKK